MKPTANCTHSSQITATFSTPLVLVVCVDCAAAVYNAAY